MFAVDLHLLCAHCFILALVQQNPLPETKWLTAALRQLAADRGAGPGWGPW